MFKNYPQLRILQIIFCIPISIGIALIALGYTSPSQGGAVTVVLTAIIGFLLVRRSA